MVGKGNDDREGSRGLTFLDAARLMVSAARAAPRHALGGCVQSELQRVVIGWRSKTCDRGPEKVAGLPLPYRPWRSTLPCRRRPCRPSCIDRFKFVAGCASRRTVSRGTGILDGCWTRRHLSGTAAATSHSVGIRLQRNFASPLLNAVSHAV